MNDLSSLISFDGTEKPFGRGGEILCQIYNSLVLEIGHFRYKSPFWRGSGGVGEIRRIFILRGVSITVRTPFPTPKGAGKEFLWTGENLTRANRAKKIFTKMHLSGRISKYPPPPQRRGSASSVERVAKSALITRLPPPEIIVQKAFVCDKFWMYLLLSSGLS